MSSRLAFPLGWLLLCAAMLTVAAGGGPGSTLTFAAAALVLGLAARIVVAPRPGVALARLSTPGSRRLHGRFLQQSRPGVPGRTRSRAPGCGH